MDTQSKGTKKAASTTTPKTEEGSFTVTRRRDLTTTHGRVAYAVELLEGAEKKWERKAAKAKRGSTAEVAGFMAERMAQFLKDLRADAARLEAAAKEGK